MSTQDYVKVQGWGCAVILVLLALAFILGFFVGRA